MDFSNSLSFSADSAKPKLHFYHANGFPLAVYQPLINELSGTFNVSALANRATWLPRPELPTTRNWQLYADDLIDYLDQQQAGPVIGVGHSLGATSTLLAAIKRPDLFCKIILIEPAMVSKPLATLVRLLPKRLMVKINPAKGTLKKPQTFNSRAHYRQHIEKFNGYAKFSPMMFDLFSQHSIKRTANQQFELVFPKEWEAHNYTQPPNIMNKLAKLPLPVAAIRGKPSIFFSEKMWQQWKKLKPTQSFLEDLNYGHLIPLESPTRCAQLIGEAVSACHK